MPAAFAGAPAHDVLGLTGLAVGQGLPLAAGAAIASPGRPVICLAADGSTMYTISALWMYAREKLDVTVVILNNSSYAILRAELDRVGAGTTAGAARRMLELSGPDLDFVALSTGMGVPASRARTVRELRGKFAAAVATSGPHLIAGPSTVFGTFARSAICAEANGLGPKLCCCGGSPGHPRRSGTPEHR